MSRESQCIHCGSKTEKVHQNNELTIRDLPFGEQALYLRINLRQMRGEKWGKKFTEELNYLPKKRTYTDRFRKKIVAEVLNSDLKNTAERNGVSEQEIETMLKDLGEDLNRRSINRISETVGRRGFEPNRGSKYRPVDRV
ncbi:MAG: transposase family protein [Microcystis aeruginosa LG13-13]|nr:transposase family protein [Microcystis aeruginosa LG13-13]